MRRQDMALHRVRGGQKVVVASILRRAVAAASISGGLPGPRPTAVVRHGKPGGSAWRCVGRSMPLTLRCRRNSCQAAKAEVACPMQTNIRTMQISSRISVRISINAAAWGYQLLCLPGSARSSVRDPAGAAASSCQNAWPSRAECSALPDGALFRLLLKRWRHMRIVATNVRFAQRGRKRLGLPQVFYGTARRCLLNMSTVEK